MTQVTKHHQKISWFCGVFCQFSKNKHYHPFWPEVEPRLAESIPSNPALRKSQKLCISQRIRNTHPSNLWEPKLHPLKSENINIYRRVRKRIGKSPVKYCSSVPSTPTSMTGLPFFNPTKCLVFLKPCLNRLLGSILIVILHYPQKFADKKKTKKLNTKTNDSNVWM